MVRNILIVSLSTHIHTTSSTFFFFTAPAPSDIYTLSLHDALPIYHRQRFWNAFHLQKRIGIKSVHIIERNFRYVRSEEHTSELQSPYDLVCRLLLEKKKKKQATAESHYQHQLSVQAGQ